jgi:hypothetical protein
MTDREMLELAVKAAGIDVRWIAECQDYYEHRPHMLPGYWDKWNPLTDDGDALRLAVALNLQVEADSFNGDTIVVGNLAIGRLLECVTEPHNDDPYAATRRAIVRAAAEIGRNMP